MQSIGRIRSFTLAIVMVVASVVLAAAQAGLDDDRVMLQGFYWESYRHGHPQKFPTFGGTTWYRIVRENAATVREGRFDLIWLPPPSFAGEFSAGYNPKEYFRLDNSYGSFTEHRAMLEELLNNGVEPIADIVINHRDGLMGWADFRNPTWGVWAICETDEAFQNPASGIADTPVEQRGRCEERPTEYTSHAGTTYQYDSFRDVAHTDRRVRQDIVRYLRQLTSAGYRGWRFDMVHGYHATWIALYNRLTNPTFSVGEYDWGAHNEQRGWIWHTATDGNAAGADRLRSASNVFDFTTLFTLEQIREGRYDALYGAGNGIGMVGDTTDGLPWKHRAVTFVQNHDLGYRTNEDGTPQQGHESDRFANNWQVEQAYAQVLTHPGVPTVFWKHYFDWGADLQNKIRALINARKVAGLHAGSALHHQHPLDNLHRRIHGQDLLAMYSPSDGSHRLILEGHDQIDAIPDKRLGGRTSRVLIGQVPPVEEEALALLIAQRLQAFSKGVKGGTWSRPTLVPVTDQRSHWVSHGLRCIRPLDVNSR